jgi:hypothetical protein
MQKSLYHAPILASLMRLSVRLDRDIRAERLTPPTTTISPTIQTISCTSIEFSLRPLACLNVSTTKSNNRLRGSGPLALPPNVLSRSTSRVVLVSSLH